MPYLIEAIIMEIPSVQRVSVIAVPDQRLYEDVCVCYITSDRQTTADDIHRYCKRKLFSENIDDGIGNMPTYYLRFDDFPTLANGKVNKLN